MVILLLGCTQVLCRNEVSHRLGSFEVLDFLLGCTQALCGNEVSYRLGIFEVLDFLVNDFMFDAHIAAIALDSINLEGEGIVS